MEEKSARFYRVGELLERMLDLEDVAAVRESWIPREFTPGYGLVYSSPATLAYNSPGAEGYGVKRAALAVPESVMLVVSPGCCARNTSGITAMPEYAGRYFYLTLDEADVVTGRYAKRVLPAVREVVALRQARTGRAPSVVFLCATCVDALLGTDFEGIARECERDCGVKVRPAYMYALTREGSQPPMVLVRDAIYSLLERPQGRKKTVGVLGFFQSLQKDCELERVLQALGAEGLVQISGCPDYQSFQELARVSLNLVLHPEARLAAEHLEKRLGIPWIELSRFFDPERNRRQYQALAAALGKPLRDVARFVETTGKPQDGVAAAGKPQEDVETTGKLQAEAGAAGKLQAEAGAAGKLRADEKASGKLQDGVADYVAAQEAVTNAREHLAGKAVAVGECLNGSAFEISAALVSAGIHVSEIYGTLSGTDAPYIRKIAAASPDTRIYFNQHHSMLYYRETGPVSVAIGKDACFYHPDAKHVRFDDPVEWFGYAGVRRLFSSLWEM